MSPDIVQYHPILSDIARYQAILAHIAQNMGPFNVTITVMVQIKILPPNDYGPVADPVTDPVTMLSRSSHGAYRASLLHWQSWSVIRKNLIKENHLSARHMEQDL